MRRLETPSASDAITKSEFFTLRISALSTRAVAGHALAKHHGLVEEIERIAADLSVAEMIPLNTRLFASSRNVPAMPISTARMDDTAASAMVFATPSISQR